MSENRHGDGCRVEAVVEDCGIDAVFRCADRLKAGLQTRTPNQTTIINNMNKLRSDSVFCKLTTEQVEQLEDWLFEEKLGYKEVLEKIEKEFGVKGSQSGLSRFYQRLAVERSQMGLVEMVGACVAATGAAQPSGVLQAGLLTLGYKCAVQFLVESPGKIREFTGLLRALTSAQALELKRVVFEREEAKRKQSEMEAERKRQEEEEQRQKSIREMNEYYAARVKRREERRLAKLAVVQAAEGAVTPEAETPKPHDESVVTVESGGVLPQPDDGAWEPKVLSGEQREYVDNGAAKEGVKPLNAA